MSFHLLSEINLTQESWCIKVCISRLWNVMDFENQDELKSVDMILIDEVGDQIHASIPNRHIRKYTNMLQEGNFCVMRDFSVDYAKNNYRPVKHTYKIFFKWDTSVNVIDDISDDNFPHYGFSFVHFENLRRHYGNKEYSIDVIGVLDYMSNIIEKRNDEGIIVHRRRDVIIRNERNDDLKVTLWGRKANEISDDAVDTSQKPSVIIITSASVSMFNGIYNVSSTSATRIYINLNVPEVTQLAAERQNIMTEQNTLLDILNKLGDQSIMVIFLYFQNNDFDTHQYNTTSFIYKNKYIYGKRFVTSVTITELLHDYEPYYFSCDGCRKKLLTKDCRQWCKACNNFVITPIPRYSVRIRVEDRTSSLILMLFDKEAQSLLDRPVTDIIKLSETERGSDVVKDILNHLIGLEIDLEIKITEHNFSNKGSTFTATKVIPKITETSCEDMLEDMTEGRQAYPWTTLRVKPPKGRDCVRNIIS